MSGRPQILILTEPLIPAIAVAYWHLKSEIIKRNKNVFIGNDSLNTVFERFVSFTLQIMQLNLNKNIIHQNINYLISAIGIFESTLYLGLWKTISLKWVLNSGSSKHGKILRESFCCNCDVINHLKTKFKVW